VNKRVTVAITAGEPAGIGPELCAMLAARHRDDPYPARLVVLGDGNVLRSRAQRIGLEVEYVPYDAATPAIDEGLVEVLHVPLDVPVMPGTPDPANAHAVLATLQRSNDGCVACEFDAVVTAPVQKSVLLDAGIPFSGHTEYFAERTGTPRVVMLLVGAGDFHPLRVALVTTHLPLHAVPAAITFDAVRETIAITEHDLMRRFGVPLPRIAVCGLNPHAGEGGHMGREEIDVIAPAIAAARSRGAHVIGPVPADTVFVPEQAQRYDAIIAMYHDQGLPTLKATSFGRGVNVTLGLPYVRTSVDHGTALDLARDAQSVARADVGSLDAALTLAIGLARPVHRP
jgi:4-hydroxythreonine-4-phosphate dehydrogenase